MNNTVPTVILVGPFWSKHKRKATKSADLSERRACETTFQSSFLISVSQPAAASQQQPASCSQPASQASQASQPAKPASQPTLHPGIEASGLQASGIDVHVLDWGEFEGGDPIGRDRF